MQAEDDDKGSCKGGDTEEDNLLVEDGGNDDTGELIIDIDGTEEDPARKFCSADNKFTATTSPP